MSPDITNQNIENLNPAANGGGMVTDDVNETVSILNIGDEKEVEQIEKKPRGSFSIIGLYRTANQKLQAFTNISLKDKVTFFQLLSIMLGAGVPLVRSLYVLGEQLKNVRLRLVVINMAGKVEGGKTLSDAMEDHHGVFADSQIGMIRAGEASGRLIDILKQVSDQVEKTAAVASKVKGALIYPAVVFVIMFGAVMVILGMVVPTLMELFTQSNAELPTSTKILLASSDFVVNYWKFIISGIFVFGGLLYLWKRTPNGKYHWNNFLIHLPIFGRLLRNVALARFTRTLSSLMQSGIPIVKSLQIDADAVGNEVYRRRLYLSAEDVSRGIPLAENLTDSQFLFPEMVVSMIAVGEQTAELETVCGKIADFYDNEVDQMAANMSKLMEPMMMVIMGVVVGGLIVAVMEPIFGLLDVVGNI